MNTRLTGPKVTIMRFRRLLAHGLLLLGTLTLLFPTACRTHSPVRVELSTIDGAIGLKTPVRTLVDREGIPHVYAANREDAAFVLGWFHARDRFLQMDIYRRAGLGRLAEILGPSVVEEDREARTIGLHTSADLAWQVLADDSLEAGIIRSYTKGVNRFLEHAFCFNSWLKGSDARRQTRCFPWNETREVQQCVTPSRRTKFPTYVWGEFQDR